MPETDPTAAADARIAEELRAACEAIDAELVGAFQELGAQAVAERQELIERAAKRKVWTRIDLERRTSRTLGIPVSDERWDRVLEEALELVEESVATYVGSLDLALVLSRGLSSLERPAEELRVKAEGLRGHLRADAEWQVDIERRQGRLYAGPAASGRLGIFRARLASLRRAAKARGGRL